MEKSEIISRILSVLDRCGVGPTEDNLSNDTLIPVVDGINSLQFISTVIELEEEFEIEFPEECLTRNLLNSVEDLSEVILNLIH